MLAVIQAVLARGVRPGQENTDSLKAEKISKTRAVAEDTDVIPEVNMIATPPALMELPASHEKSAAPSEETPLEKRMCVALGQLGDRPVDRLLAEFAGIASQVASVDAVLAKTAQAAPPAGSEAEHWHELAARTTRWSRHALVDRQRRCLVQLRAAVEAAQPPKCAPSPTPPAPPAPAAVSAQTHAVRGLPSAPRHGTSERPAARARRSITADGDKSMKKGLEALRDCDADRVLIVRKIKKLGFESPERLKQHFSQFGGVQDVHVANSMMKPSLKRPTGRLRPAALGFVVMEAAEGAQAALAHGSSHSVCSAQIEVCHFSPFKDSGDDSE